VSSSKQFTIGAGLAIVLSLALTYPAWSTSTAPDNSVNKTVSRLHQGDLVRLRSGGPMMTVNALKGDQVECVWTDLDGQPDDATFPARVLQAF
jgi:uncharacterized protein YodC (DUF2158 family)